MDYPILMADIVKSSNKDLKELMPHFKTIVNHINTKWKQSIVSPLTITLGDEFQGVVDTIGNAVRIIIDIEQLILAHQLQFKLRYVLYYGRIDTEINREIAYEMLGEGLTEARTLLNQLKDSDARFLIKLKKEDHIIERLFNDAFRIFQYYIDGWKVKDYKIASDFITHNDYKIIAKNFDLDKSSAWRRKRSLNIDEFETTKDLITNLTYFDGDNFK